MIQITPDIALDESEIRLQFTRASGPGGQNVNKVESAVQLRFDVAHSPSLPDALRARLMHLAGRRLNSQGELIIDARRFRTQERNRQDAIDRLIELIRQAAIPPKQRHATRPTNASKRRRLDAKRRRGKTKRLRVRDGLKGSD